jgi:hypothetical protein
VFFVTTIFKTIDGRSDKTRSTIYSFTKTRSIKISCLEVGRDRGKISIPLLFSKLSTINCQLSTVNCQLIYSIATNRQSICIGVPRSPICQFTVAILVIRSKLFRRPSRPVKPSNRSATLPLANKIKVGNVFSL